MSRDAGRCGPTPRRRRGADDGPHSLTVLRRTAGARRRAFQVAWCPRYAATAHRCENDRYPSRIIATPPAWLG